MAATAWNAQQPYVSAKHGVPRIVYGNLEADSQTFKAGTPVYLNSGAVTICTDGGGMFTGIAMKDATNVSSGNIEIPVKICDIEDTLICLVTNNGTAQDASDLTPGESYDWYVDSDYVFYADENDTTGPLVFIEEINDAAGASTSWGRFRVTQGSTGSLDIASL